MAIYSYAWSGGATTPTALALAAGAYSVRDANGCEAQTEAIVGQPDSIRIEMVDQSIAFCDLANGSILVDATGGIADYQYRWNTVPAQEGPLATGITMCFLLWAKASSQWNW